jgi:large subunit ribosomal protein L29
VKAEGLRELGVDELAHREKELLEQMFRLRLQKATGQLDNAVRIRETRRDIARVKTVLREKQSPEKRSAPPAAGAGE